MDLSCSECDVISVYLCCSVSVSICLVCCVFDSILNCLLKDFAMCLGGVAIVLLNVMDVFSVGGGGGGGALFYRPCMVFQRMCVLCL